MNWVISIVNQLRIYGEEIEDQRIVEKVLRSLPCKFNSVVAAIKEAKDLSTLLVDELMGSLISLETRIDRNKDSSIETAFKSQVFISKGKGRGRGRGGRNNGQQDEREDHGQEGGSDNKSFYKIQRFDKSKVKC